MSLINVGPEQIHWLNTSFLNKAAKNKQKEAFRSFVEESDCDKIQTCLFYRFHACYSVLNTLLHCKFVLSLFVLFIIVLILSQSK